MLTVRLAARPVPVIVASVLTLAIVMAPVFFNGCVMACQQLMGRSATQVEHSCHHVAASAGVRHQISGQPASCTHEHSQTAALSDEASARASDARLKAMPLAAPTFSLAAVSSLAEPRAESPPASRSLRTPTGPPLPLALRI